MTSVAPIDCLYCTLNPFAFSAWLYSSPRMYSSVKFFDPTMTVAPAFGAAGALAADISAAVSAASSPTIITERHFFLLIEPFLPVVLPDHAVAASITDGGSCSGCCAV